MYFRLRAVADMNTDDRDLSEHLQSLSDDELARRFVSGGLTELAQAMALAEIEARGLPVPASPPEPAAFVEAPYQGDLQKVASFGTATEAHVIHSFLQSAGIPAVLADAHIMQANPLMANAIGGARLLVPQAFVADALELIEAFNRGDFSLDEDADVV